MELLPPVGWGDVARKSDITELRGELRTEMAELRVELKGEIAELRDEVRTDIRQLTSRVDSIVPKVVMANAASAVAVAGLVLAAVQLG